KSVRGSCEGVLVGITAHLEIARTRTACNIRGARAVEGHSVAPVIHTTAQIGSLNQGAAVDAESGQESILATSVERLLRIHSWEVGGLSAADHDSFPVGSHGDAGPVGIGDHVI